MESVLAKAKVYDATYREAALIVAVERVAKAIEQRGDLPRAARRIRSSCINIQVCA